jgi:hypothetical protein
MLKLLSTLVLGFWRSSQLNLNFAEHTGSNFLEESKTARYNWNFPYLLEIQANNANNAD